jgi:hypothetical protein
MRRVIPLVALASSALLKAQSRASWQDTLKVDNLLQV